MEELLMRTAASRVTLRIDDTAGEEFPVRAEAVSPGELPLAGEVSFPIRASPVFGWLDDERRVLVQDDSTTAQPASPRTLIDRYGVRAQMVAPVECHGDIVALVAVHASVRRSWTPDDRAAIEDTARRVQGMLCR